MIHIRWRLGRCGVGVKKSHHTSGALPQCTQSRWEPLVPAATLAMVDLFNYSENVIDGLGVKTPDPTAPTGEEEEGRAEF